MDKNQAFNKIREGSLFNIFPEDATLRLINSADLLRIEAGAYVPRQKVPSELFIVVEGDIGIHAAGERAGHSETVKPGRSLELATLLLQEPAWKTDWIAQTGAYLIRITYEDLNRVLQDHALIWDYLKKVTCYPELQRFKNDLRMLGLPSDWLAGTFKDLMLLDYKEFRDSGMWSRQGLIIVQKGELAFRTDLRQTEQALGNFQIGNTLYWDPTKLSVFVDAAPGTKIWWLNLWRWSQNVKSSKVSFFVRLMDPVGQSLQSFSQSTRKAPKLEFAPPPEVAEEDDTDPEEYTCDEKELTRLYRKRPVIVRQHDEMDCGAACLSSISRFYGRKIDVATFRSLVGVGRDGASMYSLKKAAEVVGLKSSGLATDYEGLQSFRVPFIAILQYHFVVIYKVDDDKILYMDPGLGMTTKTREEFETDWRKCILAFLPTPELKKYPETEPTFYKYFRVMRGDWLLLGQIMWTSFLVFLLGLVLPFFLQFAFETVARGENSSLIDRIAMVGLATYALRALTSWVQSYLLSHMTARIDAKFSSLFFKRVYELPLSFFSARTVGDFVTRVDDIGRLRDAVSDHAVELFTSATVPILYFIVLWLYSSTLAIAVLCAVFVMAVMMLLLAPKLRALSRKLWAAYGKAYGYVIEQFSGLGTLKSINALLAARWRWEHTWVDALRTQREMQVSLSLITGISSAFQQSVNLIALVLAGYLYMEGKLSIGHVAAITGIVANIAGPIANLLNYTVDFANAAASLERLDDIITAAPELRSVSASIEPAFSSASNGHATHGTRGEVELQNVSFRYGEYLDNVLDEVSLKIAPGETVAFVGRSGSGKSTLGYLINLLYRPSSGKILIDGVDAESLSLAQLRSGIGMIVQDNSLFSGSIVDNIALGDNTPSLARAISAAKQADAHDFISALADGYSTILGESGSGLSGGQMQKINIARALYREPGILIMDEATSALDALSEETIIQNIRAYSSKRTTIIIAHRLNTIINADRIVVLEHGKVAQVGKHKDLVINPGPYSTLFQNQLHS
jgi:ATP-binding cassette subfamily B protein